MPDPDLFKPRMPEVDKGRDLDRIFDQARKAAAGDAASADAARHVVLVTPGRMLMLQPCPQPGSMPANVVTQVERLVSSKIKRKIAVISYTELPAIKTSLIKAIPFFGMLVAMSYIGHSVWIFEGHLSALAAGCKSAEVLIVDDAMLAHLSPEWQSVVSAAVPAIQIYVHERATHALRKMTEPSI